MLFDGVKVYVQNGNLDDVDVAYYISKIRSISKHKELQRVSFSVTDDYVDLRYKFKGYPFERIWRLSASICEDSAASVV